VILLGRNKFQAARRVYIRYLLSNFNEHNLS
jgi:hypothetical protein